MENLIEKSFNKDCKHLTKIVNLNYEDKQSLIVRCANCNHFKITYHRTGLLLEILFPELVQN